MQFCNSLAHFYINRHSSSLISLLYINLILTRNLYFQGQTPFDVSDNDMVHHLDILKKRQVKDELIRPPKKRQDIPENRRTDTETPPKLKKVEMQKVEVKIEGENEENNKEAETVGKCICA